MVILGIYYKLQTFLYLPANGIVQGMRPLIGYNYGAREHARVKKLYELTLFMSIAIMALGTVICCWPPGSSSGCSPPTPIPSPPVQGPAHHLHRLCGVGSVHHLVRRTGGPWQGRAVAGDLAVPLCGVHHAAGRSAVRRLGPDGVWHAFWITEVLTALVAYPVYHRAAARH